MSHDASHQSIIQCGVCLENFSQLRKPMILNCGHTVCLDCLSKFNRKKECPFCKAKFESNQLQTNFQLLSHEIPNKPNNDFNSKIDKLIDTTYYCQNHPEFKVLNYCSTCKFFTCVECSFNHSQNNHSVKYISNSISNNLHIFQSDLKEICLSIYTKSIKPSQEKFKKVNFESTAISKTLEGLVSCIDSQIAILNESKEKLKKFIDQTANSFNNYKTEIDKILGESVVNVINTFYFERVNAEKSLLKLIHESIYDTTARLTLFDKFELQNLLDRAQFEIDQYRSNSVVISELVHKSFENLNQEILTHFTKVSTANKQLKNIDSIKKEVQTSVSYVDSFIKQPAVTEVAKIQDSILELSSFSIVFNQKIEQIARQVLTIN